MNAKYLSFKEAALRLLKESGEPMSPQDIINRALEKGLIQTQGATPGATMGAQLYVDIQRNPKSPFLKVGKGKFALRDQKESAVSAEIIIEKQNEVVRNALKKRLLEMDAFQFEFLVGDLLKKLGYSGVKVTKSSGDKGIDVLADLTMEGITNVKTVVQVKRYKEGNNIPGDVVAQLRGSAEVDQRGLIITTSDFTKGAVEEANALNKMPIALINGEKLLTLLIKNEVGVKKEMFPLYSVDTEYFENSEDEDSHSISSGKNRGLWPLPGGIDAYVRTLFKVLNAIELGFNTRPKLTKWFMDSFDVVKSAKTAGGYVGVPRAMGLTTMKNGKIILTDDGIKVQKTNDLDLLYTVFAANVFAIEEIMEFLKSSPEPQDEENVLNFLRENLDVEWKTYAQVNFRLLWLVNMKKILRTEAGYTI